MFKKIFDAISGFVVNYPIWSAIIFIIVLFIIISIILEYTLFEHIKCKVIEKDGRFRYTSVRVRKSKKKYEVHGLHGSWIELPPEKIKIIEEVHSKLDVHGKPRIPEIHM